MKTPYPAELATLLREPPQPAHGAWQIYANVQLALATLIEQNEKIIELLGPTEKK
jgi:hypothetical protein